MKNIEKMKFLKFRKFSKNSLKNLKICQKLAHIFQVVHFPNIILLSSFIEQTLSKLETVRNRKLDHKLKSYDQFTKS